MGRIKQGLDYFPLSTDFMHDRIVRRVMKREGDSAFTVLIYIMSYLYSGEGYYVRADTDFCDELSDQLFSTDNDTVRRVIRLFLEYRLFDSALYERYSILTSEDVQRQYLFITKRRSRHHICPDYCLLPEGKTTDEQPDTVAATGENVAVSPNIATASRDTATKTALIKRKEKEKKENILPNPPSTKGGDEGGGIDETTKRKKSDLTQEDIDRMQAPADGQLRNLSGLRDNLLLYRISPPEQYAIILKSNYGIIGSPVWKGISNIRDSGGKIKLPGHYLLSVVSK